MCSNVVGESCNRVFKGNVPSSIEEGDLFFYIFFGIRAD